MSTVKRLLGVVLGVATLTGCASQNEALVMYAKASYLYGRVEAKAETACAEEVKSKALVDACAEGASVQTQVKAVAPKIEAELAKNKPDWDRIFQFTDLVIGAASKFLLVP